MTRHREVRLSDIPVLLEYWGTAPDERHRATREHEIVFQRSDVLSSAIEEVTEDETTLVGILVGAFVNDRFIEASLSDPDPFVLQRIKAWVDAGTSPFYTPEKLAGRNGSNGLNLLLVTFGMYPQPNGEPEHLIREFLLRRFVEDHAGWNIRHLMAETVSLTQATQLERQGWTVRNAYPAYHKEFPHEQVRLLTIDREAALLGHDYFLARFFTYREPPTTLTKGEKELLRAARFGARTDDHLAEMFAVGRDSIKQRWKGIYEKLRSAEPALFPELSAAGGRGPERRRVLIEYARNHPEILWP